MCGIVGIVGNYQPEVLTNLNEAISHRGPDGGGEYIAPADSLGLGMRRLAIVDLEEGKQPMANKEGTHVLVFNGEIFNAPELRMQLEAKGVQFDSGHSDTEVILRMYEAEGPDMVALLNGMFAFVLYDATRGKLFGARDRFGIKPLYYRHNGGSFAFASELKSLMQLPGFSLDLDTESLWHYLSLLYVPGKKTICEGVHRLQPGQSIEYDLCESRVKIKQWWRLEPKPIYGRSEEDWAVGLREQLAAAVRRWCMSDVPIACSLSGGIDSTAITGLMAENGYQSMQTFSLGFTDPQGSELDERRLAKQVADRWGTKHHEIILEQENLLDALPEMIWSLDEPYAGGLPSWYVFQAMSREVKVAMTGSGGDELFGNYGKFREYEKKPWERLHLWAYEHGWSGGAPIGNSYHALRRYFSDVEKKKYVRSPHGYSSGTAAFIQNQFDKQAPGHLRDRLAGMEMHSQLAEEFLFMTDRFSMAHGLEARVPFLDSELVDFVFSIPASQRVDPKNLKYLLKHAVQDLLPRELLNSRKKGFVLPLGEWLRGRLKRGVQNLLSPERLAKQGIFHPDLYKDYVVPHLEGRRDYTYRIWSVFMFQLWHLLYVEEKVRTRPTVTLDDLVS